MISEGDKVPEFTLQDRHERFYSLREFKQKYVVLYFYPKDNTPGCKIEAEGFNVLLPEFKKRDVQIIGISGGDAQSKEEFCKKYGLNLLLLSDSNFKVSEKYGVYGEKKFMGKTYMGLNRVSFVLDATRSVIKKFDAVKPLTHPKEVLDFIDKQSK